METSVKENTRPAKTITEVAEEEDDLLAIFEEMPAEDSKRTVEAQGNKILSSEYLTEKKVSEEAKIRYRKDFFRHLCYEPIWKLDEMSEPSAYRFAAHIPGSEFLIQVHTGMHRKYTDILSPYFTVKIYDLRKKVEVKQLEYVGLLEDFFADKAEIKNFIKFIDSLPLQFAARPKCPQCGDELDLINPQKISQKPFWAHSFKERERLKNKTEGIDANSAVPKEKCVYVQALLGLAPNIQETRT